MRRVMWIVVLGACLAGCTAAGVDGTRARPEVGSVSIGRVGVYYDDDTLPRERIWRAKNIRLDGRVAASLEGFLRVAGLWSHTGRDVLWMKIDRFRLPRGARWATGSFKGNDVLGAVASVDRGRTALYSTTVSTRLGAVDRGIAANFSANRALRELVEALAWELAWDLARAASRGGQAALLEAGQRAGVRRAHVVHAP